MDLSFRVFRDRRQRGMDEVGIDLISGLPDFVLHHILSFLPRIYANRTCVLSKRWKHIWDTFPIIEFSFSMSRQNWNNFAPKYVERTREFLNTVDKSLQKFTHYKLSMERLKLVTPLIDQNYVLMVNQWVSLSLKSGVRDMYLRVSTDSKDGYYTFPETAFLDKSLSGYSKLDRLHKLSLYRVHITEAVIQNINHCCPNLNVLDLKKFCGLKSLEISKLDKLEKVYIMTCPFQRELERVDISASSLKHFSFKTLGGDMLCSVNLTSCNDLKELRLCWCSITDELLHSYLSRFLKLEVLDIVCCNMLRRVKISAQQLRTLNIFRCCDVEMIEIDAPTLSFFNYDAMHMPVLFSKNVPCLMKIDYSTRSRQVGASWFSKLRKFLGRSTQRKLLTLDFRVNEVSFDLGELGEEEIPPMIEVDHLRLTSIGTISASLDCAALIDGLLWSCHPKIISLPSLSIFQRDCIEVLREKLLDREHQSCCDSSRIKCWRHHLKDAKIVKGIEDERLLSLTYRPRLLPSLGRLKEVRFMLEWDF